MVDVIWYTVVMLISGWCNFFHKKDHWEVPEKNERWCEKCRCTYVYPVRDSTEL